MCLLYKIFKLSDRLVKLIRRQRVYVDNTDVLSINGENENYIRMVKNLYIFYVFLSREEDKIPK